MFKEGEGFRVIEGGGLSHDRLMKSRVPKLLDEQMRLITAETLSRKIEDFDPDRALESLKCHKEEKILTIDMGGSKVSKIIWEVIDGKLVADDNSIKTIENNGNGANYMEFLETAAKEAKEKNINVAISFTGPLKGTCPQEIVKATNFKAALDKNYGGDFAKLFPSLKAVNNDAQAGIKAAIIEARAKGLMEENGSLVFVTNGGGVELVFFRDNEIITTRVGYVEVVDRLNRYRQYIHVLPGNTHVRLEDVASSAGIENIWRNRRGEVLSGEKISERYKNKKAGHILAKKLYKNAARVFAHGIVGIANLNGLMKEPGDTVIAYHGGGFRVPGLMGRIDQIIAKAKGKQLSFFTDDISKKNACAQGAAIAAFYK
jgi:predicted NBD/HSP70 family sugar kinase